MVDRARAAAALGNLSALLSPGGQSGASYAAIRASFLISLSSAAADFLDGGSQRATANAAKRAVTDSYGAAADAASGGPLDPEDLSFYNAEVAAEFDYIESLFGDLKLRKANGDTSLPADRIEAYGRSLDALYNELKGRAAKNAMVTWQIGPTEESCPDCLRLDGQQHRVRWFMAKNFIPRKPGAAMKCGGHRCMCSWIGPDGQPFNVEGV